MNEQWKCPQCETLCTGNFCPICGFNHANLANKTEKAVQNQGVSQAASTQQNQQTQPGQPVPPTGHPVPPIPPTRQPVSPVPPNGPKPKPVKPKKKKKIGVIIAACVVGVIVLALALLCVIPANDYQNYASVLPEKCASDESNIAKFLEKGNQALDDGDYDKAAFYYEEKVLTLDDDNQDAMIGMLRKAMAQSDMDAMVDRLNKISETSVLIAGTNKAYIVEAVDTLEASEYESLTANIEAQQATADDVIVVMNHYENYWQMFNLDEIRTDMIDKYLECYDLAVSSGYDTAFEEQLLNDALARFPDNEQFVSRQQDLMANKAEYAKSQIDTALSNGDVEQARQWYAELCNVSDEDNSAYEAKINEYEAMVNFMNQANDLLGQSDYDGLCALIDSDSDYNGATYYLVDGKYVESVESGYGVIYDVNGIYIGDIANNERSGNGKQFFYYTGLDTYYVVDGAWQNNELNGEATLRWMLPDKSVATTSGNFTDGYENGTMTVKWHDNYDWSATYKAEMGDYVDAKKNSDGYRYAYASNSEYQAWLYTQERDGHGFWVN